MSDEIASVDEAMLRVIDRLKGQKEAYQCTICKGEFVWDEDNCAWYGNGVDVHYYVCSIGCRSVAEHKIREAEDVEEIP